MLSIRITFHLEIPVSLCSQFNAFPIFKSAKMTYSQPTAIHVTYRPPYFPLTRYNLLKTIAPINYNPQPYHPTRLFLILEIFLAVRWIYHQNYCINQQVWRHRWPKHWVIGSINDIHVRYWCRQFICRVWLTWPQNFWKYSPIYVKLLLFWGTQSTVCARAHQYYMLKKLSRKPTETSSST